MRDTIHVTDDTMEAFVWFQGEAKHFNKPYSPCKKVSDGTTGFNQKKDSTKTYGAFETDSDGKFAVCCTSRSVDKKMQ